jgi:hypothetical protein
MANHGPVYGKIVQDASSNLRCKLGLDAELAAKRQAQYDPRLEGEARQFVEQITGESIGSDFHAVCRTGC